MCLHTKPSNNGRTNQKRLMKEALEFRQGDNHARDENYSNESAGMEILNGCERIIQ
jgi:hypothetical protein